MGKYTVKKGDNLSSIAKKNGLTLNQLLKLNPQIKNSNLIGIGDTITLSKSDPQTTTQITYFKPQDKELFKGESKIRKQMIDSAQYGKEERIKKTNSENQRRSKLIKKGLATGATDFDKVMKQQRALRDYGYTGRIDGIWGDGSEAAFKKAQAAGYDFDSDGNLVEFKNKSKSSEIKNNANIRTYNPQTGQYEDFKELGKVVDFRHTYNNPAIAAIEDAVVGLTNMAYRGITGKNDYIVKNRDITNLPEDQKNVLRSYYLNKGGSGNQSWKSSDYRKLQGTYTGGGRSIIERMSTPEGIIEHTLGQYSYEQDPNTGEVYVKDTYDWNIGESSPNQGSYSTIRDIMGIIGTRSSDPKGQARKYNINLGNPKDW